MAVGRSVNRNGARLVGRRDERARLDAALRASEGGSAVILEVIGEPGIGKSSVLRTLCGTAREADALVLEGGRSHHRASAGVARAARG